MSGAVEGRIWSDGTRHWFDGMFEGYYMDEGREGVYISDGARVNELGWPTIHTRAEFTLFIKGVLIMHPGLLA